ncbi:MAG: hypothetical protein ACNA8H_13980 [Anaerolineales bacterium]
MTKSQDPPPELIRRYFPDEARDHARLACGELRKGVESIFPAGVAKHGRAARREMLLALRSIIDAALDRGKGSPAK